MNVSRVGLKHINDWARERGGEEVWAAWSEIMQQQVRHVAPERLNWDTLQGNDKELDTQIAIRVAMDFISYLRDVVE